MIHLLRSGLALCGRGMPAALPVGDLWVCFNDPFALRIATCGECAGALRRERAMPDDSPVGFDRAPERYMAHGRETIDRMRDRAFVVAEAHLGDAGTAANTLADVLFCYHCEVTAMKYEDRAGRKGDEKEDREKAIFYRRMANHVRGFGADPRAERADFMAYRRIG